MFELDDSSLGHTDIYSNRYSDVAFSPMDFFVTDSLQDMLDIDIRSEVATVLGGNTDITLFNDLPPLELDSPTLSSKYYFNMEQEDNMDLYDTEANSVMVDPSSVMPVLFGTDTRINKFGMLNYNTDSTDSSNLSLANKQSHFSFSPTKINTTELANTNHTENKGTIRIRSDLIDDTVSKKSKQFSSNIISKNSVKTIVTKPTEKTTFISGNIIVGQRGVLSSIVPSQKATNKISHVSKITTKNTVGYPKPAYSYSCLIAMALKNSKYGCLPVSEIYSFMCEHFPYFKTAPNGWKNSVRHNLSLNKCFEKIEKPPTTSSQRKGCLWAMNPSKISKMDEEVQKWSRKDPITIRRAMVFPDTLEALERGEMKHSFQEEEDIIENDNDIEETEEDEVEGSNSDSGSEPELEQEPEDEPDIEVDSGEEDEQEELENLLEREEEYTDHSDSEDEDCEVNVTDTPIKLGNFKFEIINQIINNQPVELQLLQNKYTKDNDTEAKRSRVELQYSYMPQSISSTTPSRRKTPLTHRAT